MARNRKRAKERRPRTPQGASGIATARGRSEADRAGTGSEPAGADVTPSPIEHATPDTELAEAQLAAQRPLDAVEGEADEAELEAEAAELAPAPSGAAAPAPRSGNRLITFLQGSWRELQRVQWPDRRQVMQATGVVIGFVIVAGVYLGVADAVANKLVNLILQ